MRQEIIWATFAFWTTQVFAQSGSIAGTVTGADNNSPLPGAGILAVRRADTAPPLFFQSTTARDGSYVVSNIPAGDYTVCARYKTPFTGGSRNDFWASRAYVAEEIAYLDSCDWSQTQPKTNVGAGQVNVNIRLQRGVNVSVLVDDPANLLEAATAPGASLQITLLDASGKARATLPLLDNVNGLRRFGATLPARSSSTWTYKSGERRWFQAAVGLRIRRVSGFHSRRQTGQCWPLTSRFRNKINRTDSKERLVPGCPD